jgi:glutathione-regulated potassium-efflux system ancillary protein KefG
MTIIISFHMTDIKQKIAILYFHPTHHKSRINKALLKKIEDLEGITLRNMYDLYPDFHINVKQEQEMLLGHDIIIWQHPFYWYSSPSLLKEWIDLVLQHGFAYGREGTALKGKKVMSAITSGGRREVYQKGGLRNYTLPALLAPFSQTVNLCNMVYLPPFVVHGTHLLEDKAIEAAAEEYKNMILSLRDDIFSLEDINAHEYMNDLLN